MRKVLEGLLFAVTWAVLLVFFWFLLDFALIGAGL